MLRMLMNSLLAATVTVTLPGSVGQSPEDSPLNFALYSPSWASSAEQNLLSGLRLVVDNHTESPILLDSLEFAADVANMDSRKLDIDLRIPATGLAEKELIYTDLLSLNACVNKTLQENWRLVEISNYTLNPSVRRLIIEDTSAFRIYQCVSSVVTRWVNEDTGDRSVREEWVLYHFESRPR